MKLIRYLIIDRDKKTRLTTRRPDLGPHEYACILQLDVPDALFNRPLSSVTVTVPMTTIASFDGTPEVEVRNHEPPQRISLGSSSELAPLANDATTVVRGSPGTVERAILGADSRVGESDAA